MAVRANLSELCGLAHWLCGLPAHPAGPGRGYARAAVEECSGRSGRMADRFWYWPVSSSHQGEVGFFSYSWRILRFAVEYECWGGDSMRKKVILRLLIVMLGVVLLAVPGRFATAQENRPAVEVCSCGCGRTVLECPEPCSSSCPNVCSCGHCWLDSCNCCDQALTCGSHPMTWCSLCVIIIDYCAIRCCPWANCEAMPTPKKQLQALTDTLVSVVRVTL